MTLNNKNLESSTNEESLVLSPDEIAEIVSKVLKLEKSLSEKDGKVLTDVEKRKIQKEIKKWENYLLDEDGVVLTDEEVEERMQELKVWFAPQDTNEQFKTATEVLKDSSKQLEAEKELVENIIEKHISNIK